MARQLEWADADWGFFNLITRFSFVLLFVITFIVLLAAGATLPAATAGVLLLLLIVILWVVPAGRPKVHYRWVHTLHVPHPTAPTADSIASALRSAGVAFKLDVPPLLTSPRDQIYTISFEDGMRLWIAPLGGGLFTRTAPARTTIVLSVSEVAPEKIERQVMKVVKDAISGF